MNLRKDSNFIHDIFVADINSINNSPQFKHPSKSVWPSEALANIGVQVGECTRSLYYKIKGIPASEQMNLTGRYICDAGLMYESYYINKFKDKDILVDSQVKFDFTIPGTDIKVNGKMDCIIKDGLSKSVIEIKSMSEFKSMRMMKDEVPLPNSTNLMQAMLYKYYLSNTEEGITKDVSNVYLMYINRGTGATFYYKVNIGEDGYPVLTVIDQAGKDLGTIKLSEVEGFDKLKTNLENESYAAKLAELKINIKDIFDGYKKVYNHINNNTLPKCDYTLKYDLNKANSEFQLGRISKIALNKVKKGELVGDSKCQYCNYKTKCLSDSGINFK